MGNLQRRLVDKGVVPEGWVEVVHSHRCLEVEQHRLHKASGLEELEAPFQHLELGLERVTI